MTISLDVAVVGGGIAGLATAAALRNAGHKVTVYEQSRFLHEVGAAIHLQANASRVLRYLGFDADRARQVTNAWTHSYNGATLETNFMNDVSYVEKEYKSPWYMFHRVDLHDELKRLAASQDGPGEPAVLNLGRAVTSVSTEDTSLTLADGTTVKADVIIGADGVHSQIVRAVTGQDSEATPTGQSAYRFIMPISTLLEDPETAWLVQDKPITLSFCRSEDRRLVSYPCRENTLMNFVGIHPEKNDGKAVEDWNVAASADDLLKTYDTFHPRVKAILKKAETMGDLKIWRLLSRKPLSNWTKGNVCIVGDAAHPMLPHSGQGGAQSIEDAGALGVLLSDISSKEQIPERLTAFETLRYRRASAIQILSTHGQDEAHKCHKQARPYVDGPIPSNPREFHHYLYSYHILDESRKVLDKIK